MSETAGDEVFVSAGDIYNVLLDARIGQSDLTVFRSICWVWWIQDVAVYVEKERTESDVDTESRKQEGRGGEGRGGFREKDNNVRGELNEGFESLCCLLFARLWKDL